MLLAGNLSADGVLDGDLVIRGGADPKLTYERAGQLAHQLRARGLREIKGDIVIDRSYFAAASYDPARFDNEPRRGYNVGPDALLVNFQAVQFTFSPSADGQGVRVTAEPDLPTLEIASRVHLVKEPCGSWRRNLQYDVQQNGMLALVSFSGTIGADCGDKIFTLSVVDAPSYTESILRWTWSEVGGQLRGKVRAGKTPDNAKPFYRDESEPLANLVRDMNKFSNNVMARQIYLALSAERAAGVPGSEGASDTAVRDWLKSKGIDAPGLVIENGSGLGRETRITAGTLAALLRNAWSSQYMPELMSSLSIYGADGTLKLRPPAAWLLKRISSGGTLNGVQSLAGYVARRQRQALDRRHGGEPRQRQRRAARARRAGRLGPCRRQAVTDVLNQPPPLEGYDAFSADPWLTQAVKRAGVEWVAETATDLGGYVGSAAAQSLAATANRTTPQLKTHDRFGHRIDLVEYDASYHALMQRATLYAARIRSRGRRKAAASAARAAPSISGTSSRWERRVP